MLFGAAAQLLFVRTSARRPTPQQPRKNLYALTPTSLAGDEFALELVPEARIKFVRGDDGKVSEINVLNRAGVWEKAAKDRP